MSLETDIGQLAKENTRLPKTSRPTIPFKLPEPTTIEDTIQFKISHILERFADLSQTVLNTQAKLIDDFGKQQD